MIKPGYKIIADAIYRSGIIRDKNKVRQQGREAMRQLIANDLAGTIYGEDASFDRDEFLRACNV